MRFVARIIGMVAGLLALPLAGATLLGRPGAIAGSALALVALLWIWLWLPRLAHGAFETGDFKVAARRYRWLARLASSATRERAATLSRAGCAVATGHVELAERLLGSLDPAALTSAEQTVWFNNRACVDLAASRDPNAALALADQATALRPDVPALQHTRAMALLAVGRVDDAIGVLDAMRTTGELPRQLEADRCRELARAWTQKGQPAYAEDYRLRAETFSRHT